MSYGEAYVSNEQYGQPQYYQPQEVNGNGEAAKGPRAPLYQKTDQQIKILNQWWKSKTRGGNIDKTLVDVGEKQKVRLIHVPALPPTAPLPPPPPVPIPTAEYSEACTLPLPCTCCASCPHWCQLLPLLLPSLPSSRFIHIAPSSWSRSDVCSWRTKPVCQ